MVQNVKWSAIEVKLGAKQVDEAANTLKSFKEKVGTIILTCSNQVRIILC